ncbi:hypothetical protein ACVI1I_006410 [Bradyrhizobium sp. USDA 4459]
MVSDDLPLRLFRTFEAASDANRVTTPETRKRTEGRNHWG